MVVPSAFNESRNPNSHHANFQTCAISSIDFKSRFQECYKLFRQIQKLMFQPCCKLSKKSTNHVVNVLRLSKCPSKNWSTCAADSKRAANLNFQTRRTSSNSFWHTQQFQRWKRRAGVAGEVTCRYRPHLPCAHGRHTTLDHGQR